MRLISSMKKVTPQNVHQLNEKYRSKSPTEIIAAALSFSEKPVVTTSFGAYSAALLHAAVKVKEDIQVIWCDTGYNTLKTYEHAQYLIDKLNLNIDIFSPKYTNAYIDKNFGRPSLGDSNYDDFAKIVKLDPFKESFKKHNPDLWITNIRKNQTEYRDTAAIFSLSKDGILKVSPFYFYTNAELEAYILMKNLPLEFDYFDPLKLSDKMECGIHLNN